MHFVYPTNRYDGFESLLALSLRLRATVGIS